jgi:hypothetical protein
LAPLARRRAGARRACETRHWITRSRRGARSAIALRSQRAPADALWWLRLPHQSCTSCHSRLVASPRRS